MNNSFIKWNKILFLVGMVFLITGLITLKFCIDDVIVHNSNFSVIFAFLTCAPHVTYGVLVSLLGGMMVLVSFLRWLVNWLLKLAIGNGSQRT